MMPNIDLFVGALRELVNSLRKDNFHGCTDHEILSLLFFFICLFILSLRYLDATVEDKMPGWRC